MNILGLITVNFDIEKLDIIPVIFFKYDNNIFKRQIIIFDKFKEINDRIMNINPSIIINPIIWEVNIFEIIKV